MLNFADEASPLSVPEEAILGATARFLQRSSGGGALAQVGNIVSPDSGRSDLAFVKRDQSGLAVARLHRQENFADFFLSAAAYQCWLKECLDLTRTILHRAIDLDVYLISCRFPPARSWLWKAISKIPGLVFATYRILSIEGQQAPAVSFEFLDPAAGGMKRGDALRDSRGKTPSDTGGGQPSTVSGLSPAEMDEFHRLTARYL